jgi:ring-1,2-phenylacetyl-CoA epoxidase subunit PaaB
MSGEKHHTNNARQFYEEYEVFSQKKDTTPVQYQFSLLAPNQEMAMIMAKENFFRRDEVHDIWVVKRSGIRKLSQSEKESLKRLEKPYRETKGYADLNERWRSFREGTHPNAKDREEKQA